MSSGNKALLASASYIDFVNSNGSLRKGDDIRKDLQRIRYLTESQVKQFLDNYQVLDQQLEPPSGFSAMVVREKRTGKNIFVVREAANKSLM